MSKKNNKPSNTTKPTTTKPAHEPVPHAEVTPDGLKVTTDEGTTTLAPHEIRDAVADLPAEVRAQVLEDAGLDNPDAERQASGQDEASGQDDAIGQDDASAEHDASGEDGQPTEAEVRARRVLDLPPLNKIHFARCDAQGKVVERLLKVNIPPTTPPEDFEYGKDERCPSALFRKPSRRYFDRHREVGLVSAVAHLADHLEGWAGEWGLHQGLCGLDGWPTNRGVREELVLGFLRCCDGPPEEMAARLLLALDSYANFE